MSFVYNIGISGYTACRKFDIRPWITTMVYDTADFLGNIAVVDVGAHQALAC